MLARQSTCSQATTTEMSAERCEAEREREFLKRSGSCEAAPYRGGLIHGRPRVPEAEWKPLQQSVFTAHSAQSIKDPSEVGGYILVTQYGLSYQHFWLGTRFSTLLDYSFTSEDYKKQNKDRHDKDGVFSVTMSYDYTPSVNFEIKYQIDTLNSNKDTDSFYIGPNDNQEVIRTLGYDNSMIMLKAKVQI